MNIVRICLRQRKILLERPALRIKKIPREDWLRISVWSHVGNFRDERCACRHDDWKPYEAQNFIFELVIRALVDVASTFSEHPSDKCHNTDENERRKNIHPVLHYIGSKSQRIAQFACKVGFDDETANQHGYVELGNQTNYAREQTHYDVIDSSEYCKHGAE